MDNLTEKSLEELSIFYRQQFGEDPDPDFVLEVSKAIIDVGMRSNLLTSAFNQRLIATCAYTLFSNGCSEEVKQAVIVAIREISYIESRERLDSLFSL